MSEALLIQTVASKTSGEIFAAIGVTYPAGSTCTCVNGSTELKAKGTDGAFIFNIPSLGDWEVSCTDGTNETSLIVNITGQYQNESVSLCYYSNILSENTWEQISTASEAGAAANYWNIGDTIDVNVDGETLTFAIMGFNHDDKADGSGKAGITFGMKNLMSTKRAMNSSNTNSGGFTGSAMYSYLQDTLLPAMPSDLQMILKSVNKLTSAGQGSSTINTDSMKLFLFSEAEVFGTKKYSAGNEGTQYSYFEIAADTDDYLQGNGVPWFLRSPCTYNLYKNNCFCCANNSNNKQSYSPAGNQQSVRFGFCI